MQTLVRLSGVGAIETHRHSRMSQQRDYLCVHLLHAPEDTTRRPVLSGVAQEAARVALHCTT